MTRAAMPRLQAPGEVYTNSSISVMSAYVILEARPEGTQNFVLLADGRVALMGSGILVYERSL